jgi:hypothetical protein
MMCGEKSRERGSNYSIPHMYSYIDLHITHVIITPFTITLTGTVDIKATSHSVHHAQFNRKSQRMAQT